MSAAMSTHFREYPALGHDGGCLGDYECKQSMLVHMNLFTIAKYQYKMLRAGALSGGLVYRSVRPTTLNPTLLLWLEASECTLWYLTSKVTMFSHSNLSSIALHEYKFT